ncbi:hypothetical protein H5410_020677 [Solanum commersonii]|uniref:Uncharacterized protein n=1 Tax=Solanum commersonii TaxID=4109 RepID=A0A9J5ZD22_SOLCO|nr:hypothetical protein H5410_020677 [Solanum commersonii]
MCFLENKRKARHLFLHRKITCLWRLFINLKGFSWTMPRRLQPPFKVGKKLGLQQESGCRWRIIPANIWWTIWKERNSRCFENIENSIEQIKLNCILILCFWCNQIQSNDPVSIIDKKGRQIFSRYFMCDQDAKVNGHLLLHCKVDTNLWNMFFCILGVCWETLHTTKGMLDSWKEIGRRNSTED